MLFVKARGGALNEVVCYEANNMAELVGTLGPHLGLNELDSHSPTHSLRCQDISRRAIDTILGNHIESPCEELARSPKVRHGSLTAHEPETHGLVQASSLDGKRNNPAQHLIRKAEYVHVDSSRHNRGRLYTSW